MEQQPLIEQIFKVITGTVVYFNTQNQTEQPTPERAHPPHRLVYDFNFPQDPELAQKWQQYTASEDLCFTSFWQAALGFARFLKGNTTPELLSAKLGPIHFTLDPD